MAAAADLERASLAVAVAVVVVAASLAGETPPKRQVGLVGLERRTPTPRTLTTEATTEATTVVTEETTEETTEVVGLVAGA